MSLAVSSISMSDYWSSYSSTMSTIRDNARTTGGAVIAKLGTYRDAGTNITSSVSNYMSNLSTTVSNNWSNYNAKLATVRDNARTYGGAVIAKLGTYRNAG